VYKSIEAAILLSTFNSCFTIKYPKGEREKQESETGQKKRGRKPQELDAVSKADAKANVNRSRQQDNEDPHRICAGIQWTGGSNRKL